MEDLNTERQRIADAVAVQAATSSAADDVAKIGGMTKLGDVGKVQLVGQQQPSIGRVVHYQRYGSPGGEHKAEPSPAVITQVLDAATKRCQLFVMNPNGLYFNDTPYADSPTPGHWNWPPRA